MHSRRFVIYLYIIGCFAAQIYFLGMVDFHLSRRKEATIYAHKKTALKKGGFGQFS